MQLRLRDGSPVSGTYPMSVGCPGVTAGTRSSIILVRAPAAPLSCGTPLISASWGSPSQTSLAEVPRARHRLLRRPGRWWRPCSADPLPTRRPGPGCRAGLIAGVRAAALIWLAGRSGEPIAVPPTYRYLKDQAHGRRGEKKRREEREATVQQNNDRAATSQHQGSPARRGRMRTWRPGRAQSGL